MLPSPSERKFIKTLLPVYPLPLMIYERRLTLSFACSGLLTLISIFYVQICYTVFSFHWPYKLYESLSLKVNFSRAKLY